MLIRVRDRLVNFPTPTAGLALGIASLGWCWENAFPANGYAQLTGAVIAAFLLVLVIGKLTLNLKVLWDELGHPVIGSVIPTSAMAAMVISKALGNYSEGLAMLLWYTATAMHLLFFVLFATRRLRQFDMNHMLPSWFVPPVGLVVATLTCPGGSSVYLAGILLNFGLIAYGILLPFMLYRLIFNERVADAAQPTIAILAAPPSLCLAGYLSFVSEPSLFLVMVLQGIAILMTVVIYLAFWKLLRLPFSPGYAAFTFPMVIGSTALFKSADYFQRMNLDGELVMQMTALAWVELVVATVVVVYVALRYLHHYGWLSLTKTADA